MYDRFFLAYPRFYTLVTMIGRWLILLSPAFYVGLTRARARILAGIKAVWSRLTQSAAPADHFDHKPGFRLAALEISDRGFDAVVFGHTHLRAADHIANGTLYLNTGFWAQSAVLCSDRPWPYLVWVGPIVSQRRARTGGGTGDSRDRLT
jgi:UDP-2,3-diacylglucosamine pyrophosphatase LpxH